MRVSTSQPQLVSGGGGVGVGGSSAYSTNGTVGILTNDIGVGCGIGSGRSKLRRNISAGATGVGGGNVAGSSSSNTGSAGISSAICPSSSCLSASTANHHHLQHSVTCEQSTQTPDSISRETKRHKLKAFKFSFNSVTTPALNLR